MVLDEPQQVEGTENAHDLFLVRDRHVMNLVVAHDAGRYWGRRSFLKKPGVVQVKIGPMISTEGKKARAVNDEAKAWIEGAMTRLLGAPEKEVAAEK